MAVTGEVIHRPTKCSACGQPVGQQAPFQITTGLYVLDIERSEQGIEVSHIKHLYGQCACPCGHVTQTKPGSCPDEPGWTVALTEWHLVGPMLAALIICLCLRLRLSRNRIREFLQDWLGITLSVGCIQQCLTEGGRAVAPVEEELVTEIQQSELLHADETGWKESGRTVWLWVLRSATVTLYIIGRRSWVIARKISHGTRTAEGSRAYTLLASVIDTCRQRGISPWPYIAQVIAERRQGKVAPPIPQALA